MRQLLPRGLLTPLGRLADPSVPYRELTREFGVVRLVLSSQDFRPPLFQDGAPRRGGVLPLLGVKARSFGSDCLSLGTVIGPVGGRLAVFAHQDVVQRSVYSFFGRPRVQTRATILTKISSLLVKKAIIQVNHFPSLCFSPIVVSRNAQVSLFLSI